jgi:3-hydroxyacyl-[acyl-carrier-protein] dehydratase
MDYITLIPSELLPHKKPMLLIDKVIETDFKNNIVVETFVKEDLIFFQGHFEDYPILPGVIMIEMMFQACGLLNRVTNQETLDSGKPKIGKAVRIKSATFINEVRPNTTLTIKAERIGGLFSFSEYKAEIFDNKNLVCKAELTTTILP